MGNTQDALAASDSVILFPEYRDWSISALIISAWIESDLKGDVRVDSSVMAVGSAMNMLRDVRADMRRLRLSFDSDQAKRSLMLALLAYASLESNIPAWEISMPTQAASDSLRELPVTIHAPMKRGG